MTCIEYLFCKILKEFGFLSSKELLFFVEYSRKYIQYNLNYVFIGDLRQTFVKMSRVGFLSLSNRHRFYGSMNSIILSFEENDIELREIWDNFILESNRFNILDIKTLRRMSNIWKKTKG
jgi:hypothetical protein